MNEPSCRGNCARLSLSFSRFSKTAWPKRLVVKTLVTEAISKIESVAKGVFLTGSA